ncbi:MAG: hypothetical protein KGS45_06495 [Planctomycetes bacterium]|nr:hypothetical protein [Planctomycetota bacterium]
MLITSVAIPGGSSPPNWLPWVIGIVIGVVVFAMCRLLIRLHWKKVRQNPSAGEFASVWTDVILRVVSYVGVFVMLLSGLGLAAMLFGGSSATGVGQPPR